jgi:aminomethyltransferase
MPETLQRTPLHALHAELGAKFTPFAGYEMPVQYKEGLRAEHLHTRAHAGLFDVSHMGQVRVTGAKVEEALEGALPLDFDGWPEGLQRYTLLLNERGGIEDDLMVTRLKGEVRLVVNASTKAKDLALLQRLCPSLRFEVLDHALIALQGPDAEHVLPAARELKFMQTAMVSNCLVSRSGYTGEDGFEISVPTDEADSFARRLLADERVKPVGLGARDTLRLEAGLHLYGQDMNADTTVLEARLGWAIARSRRAGGKKEGGFPGADVYLRQTRDGVRKKLQGLVGDENVPIRHDSLLVSEEGEVGVVTSGTISPSLQKPIMLGYVNTGAPENLFAMVRGARRAVKSAKLPFVPKRYNTK